MACDSSVVLATSMAAVLRPLKAASCRRLPSASRSSPGVETFAQIALPDAGPLDPGLTERASHVVGAGGKRHRRPARRARDLGATQVDLAAAPLADNCRSTGQLAEFRTAATAMPILAIVRVDRDVLVFQPSSVEQLFRSVRREHAQPALAELGPCELAGEVPGVVRIDVTEPGRAV